MKRIAFVICLLLALISLPCLAAPLELKGVWVSSVYNLDYPSRPGLSARQLADEADEIIENAKRWGLNAIFLQMRPAGDALYSSDIYPWSAWLSGTQGQPADGGFDPLEYFIQKAHGLEIQVHAWINPYRITRVAKDTRADAFASLADGHPAHALGDAVVFHTDGCLYFDPGKPEARQLIVDGVMEIIEKYQVDGVHMDDYFYPAGQFDDDATYAEYGQGFAAVGDFRRACVTQLIQTLQGRIKAHDRYIDFGVSPFGVWANQSQHPDGSATRGDSSYYSHYADTKAWVEGNMLDYIMPQLYWHIGSEEADFDTLLSWWCDVAEGSQVKLYIGMAAYRMVDAAEGSVWSGPDEIIRQLQRLESTQASGICFFRYGSVAQQQELAQLAGQYFALPAESLLMPYPPLSIHIGGLDFPHGTLAQAGGTLAAAYTAPPGSRVDILLPDRGFALAQSAGGTFEGEVAIPGGGAAALRPMVATQRHGLVSLDISRAEITVVNTAEAVALTRISGQGTPAGHTVTFFTEHPVVAWCSVTGTSAKLYIKPVRMAVLFEDDFFEAMSFSMEGDTGVYTFILPVSPKEYDCSVTWRRDSIDFDISYK